MEEMNREEIIEELEQKAETEENREGLSVTMDEDVYAAATVGGFDLKSAAIATGVTVLIGGLVHYGPKAYRWVKNHLPAKSKARPEETDEKFNTEDAEDAEFREADDENDEPDEDPKKK